MTLVRMRLIWVVALLTLIAGSCSATEDTSGRTSSTAATSTTHATTSSVTAASSTVPSATVPEARTTTTVTQITTSTTPSTTTLPPTTTWPPMQCSFGPLDEPEDCYYWGFIKSVDPSGKKMVFDLARFEYYGEEEYEFELVNRNPLLRTLQIADDVVVFACPPADGTSVPDLGCGSMSEFREYTVGDLESWVDNGAEFWGLRMDSDEIAIIEQWWHP